MSLVLEIEFLTGVCRAARGPGETLPDWPPETDRVFSALVSAWGIRGERPEERAALEWLEEQSPPAIRASGYSSRCTPDVFVPPNDAKSSSTVKTYLQVLPARRLRQPRKFPVARPDDPNVEFSWAVTPDPNTIEALNEIASCVGYLGHSASLARCRFRTSEAEVSGSKPAERMVYSGRLRELEAAHHSKPSRPVIRPGTPVHPKAEPLLEHTAEWLVLEAVSGDIPDVRASAIITRILRQALMAGYKKIG